MIYDDLLILASVATLPDLVTIFLKKFLIQMRFHLNCISDVEYYERYQKM